MKKIVSLALVLLVTLSSFTSFAAENENMPADDISKTDVYTGFIGAYFDDLYNREIIEFPLSPVISKENNVSPFPDYNGHKNRFYFTVKNNVTFDLYLQFWSNAGYISNFSYALYYVDTSNNLVELYSYKAPSGVSFQPNYTGSGSGIRYAEKQLISTGELTSGVVYCLESSGAIPENMLYNGAVIQERFCLVSYPVSSNNGFNNWGLEISEDIRRLYLPYYIYENALHVDSLNDGDTPITIVDKEKNQITVPDENGQWVTKDISYVYSPNNSTNSFVSVNTDHTETTFTYNTVDNSISISTVDNSTHTTITNNYYFYGSGSGGGSSGDSGGGSGGSSGGSGGGSGGDSGGENSWWQELLAGGVSGIIDFVGSILFGVFDGIIKLLDQLKDLIFQLVDFGASFVEFLGTFITFLPPEILTVLSAGVSVAIFLGIWRLIKG